MYSCFILLQLPSICRWYTLDFVNNEFIIESCPSNSKCGVPSMFFSWSYCIHPSIFIYIHSGIKVIIIRCGIYIERIIKWHYYFIPVVPVWLFSDTSAWLSSSVFKMFPYFLLSLFISASTNHSMIWYFPLLQGTMILH